MKMKAQVKLVTAHVKRIIASQPGNTDMGIPMPDASWVEMEEGDAGYYLFRYSSDGRFAGDSWFSTIEECQQQARFEYGIQKQDWRDE